tara:strand:+ start:1010 stop:1489 length:480 start_codon:yes stop_codon:yes gene_type:complete
MKQTIKRHLNKRKYTRNLRKLRKKYTRNMRKATRNLLKKSRRFMNKTYKIQRGGAPRTNKHINQGRAAAARAARAAAKLPPPNPSGDESAEIMAGLEAARKELGDLPPPPRRGFGEPEAVCELKDVGINKFGRVLPKHKDLRKQIAECLNSKRIDINLT